PLAGGDVPRGTRRAIAGMAATASPANSSTTSGPRIGGRRLPSACAPACATARTLVPRRAAVLVWTAAVVHAGGMQTRVSEMLGVEFPILAFSHCRDVVAAVTNAGGFGVLGAVAHTPEQLEIDLGWIEEQTKGRPYGLDLLLPTKYAGADDGGLDREAVRQLLPPEQQQFVDDILRRYGVPELDDETKNLIWGRGGTLSISPKGYEPLLDIAFAHGIRLVASALGPPPPDLIERA